MDQQKPGSIDPEGPHAFLERMNVPFDVPRAVGVRGAGGPTYPFLGEDHMKQCAICSKDRSDPVHAASQAAADGEKWPV
jgi:hypothetical protein